VRRWLKLPTSCIRDGGGTVRQRLEILTTWREGVGVVQLKGEANLLYQSRACLFVSSECLLTMVALINVEKTATCLAILQNKIVDM
jgi:hypothetical protein